MYILNKSNIVPQVLLWMVVMVSMVVPLDIGAYEPEDITLNNKELRGGWYTLDPYQYQREDDGVKTLTGLDFELMKVISKEVGQKIVYQPVLWENLLQEVRQGKKDFATGALYSDERAQYAYFSVPYRYEEDSLFLLRTHLKKVSGKSLQELVDYLKNNKLKIGVVDGFIYADPILNKYIGDLANKDLIVKTRNDYESLELLLNNEVEGFLADRIVGATCIWRMQVGQKIAEHRLNIERPIHIIFSKETVNPKLVEKYNSAIKKLENTTDYQKIVSWYLYPVLFLQTEDAGWFKCTEVLGTIAFAISGLIIAFKERATLFGALIFAILPSLGGGLMRDVIFGRNPVGALQSPVYLCSVLLTVLVGFGTIKLLSHFRRRYEIPGEIEDFIRQQASNVLIITDAIGLATFTVTGVIVSLLAKADPLWLWGPFFAFLTGAGGGILRDMLSKARYIAALEGELYGEIAIIWGFFLSVFIMSGFKDIQPEYIQHAVVITILGVFITRLAVHFMHVPNARFGRELQ